MIVVMPCTTILLSPASAGLSTSNWPERIMAATALQEAPQDSGHEMH